MEFNPKSAEKAETTVAEILKLLEDLNYRMLVVPAKPYGTFGFRKMSRPWKGWQTWPVYLRRGWRNCGCESRKLGVTSTRH
jgi:hypothetical protein